MKITGNYFSPHGGATAALVALYAVAKIEILVGIFSFTSQPIADALVSALRRGVRVSVVCDNFAATEPGTKMAIVKAAGATVLIDKKHRLFHDKVSIVDQTYLALGSFNYTYEAEHGNAECLKIIHDAKTAQAFISNFNTHALHSEPMA